MLNEFLNSVGITPHQFKIFVASFILVAVMVGLQQLGVHSPFSFLSLDK